MNESKPDINKVLFMHLVSMLAMSAIQQMGKLVDPATGKAAINLEAAQATIDMLDMLFTKTKNNLDAAEEKLMKETLASLKLNFVETKDEEERKPDGGPAKTGRQTPDTGRQTTDSGEKQAESDKGKQTSNPSADGPNAESKIKQEASAGEDKTPKYHKKYE